MLNEYYEEDFSFDPPKGNSNGDELKNGELVRCVLLDSFYPYSYQKELDALNKAEKEKADNLGLEYEPAKPSFKDGGISFNVAVTHRLDNNNPTIDYKAIANEVTLPSYHCFTGISAITPKMVFDKGWGSFTKGVLDVKGNGSLYIGKITPDAYPAKNWDTGLPDAEKETARLSSWTDLLKMYSQFTEEEAKNYLLKSLSQRYIFVRKQEDKGFSLIRPRTGVVFEGRVRKKEGTNFFDIERFQWNKDLRQNDIFGSPYAYIDDDSVALAEAIIVQREQDRIAREQKEQIKKQKEAALDEVPF